MLTTPLCKTLNIRHPILSAPMAGVAGGTLAGAVSAAGGLGFIGGGYGDRAWLERELDLVGNHSFGVGFISWALKEKPELLQIALDRAPKALFLSFGSLASFADEIKKRDITLIAQIQTVEQAIEAKAQGADIIVAQGTEAGGHGGQRATLPLVPAVVDVMDGLPVIAAGGIADGRGLAAALMLGADAVLCGTAFYACTEALTHPNAKQAAVAASGDTTIRSSVFDIARGLDWPKSWNLRTLQNQFSQQWQGRPQTLNEAMPSEKPAFAKAVAQGDTNIAPVIVGEGVDLLLEQQSASQIIENMVRRAETAIGDWQSR